MPFMLFDAAGINLWSLIIFEFRGKQFMKFRKEQGTSMRLKYMYILDLYLSMFGRYRKNLLFSNRSCAAARNEISFFFCFFENFPRKISNLLF